MAASDIRKNFNMFVDGRGYAGKVEEYNPPKLTLVTEEFRAGGMDMPIDLTLGMEKMTCDWSMKSYDLDVLSLFGVKEGAVVPVTVREALESFDGTVTPVIRSMRGKITEIDEGTSKPGEAATLKITMSLTYYKMTHGGRVIHEVDAENMVRIINGVDVLRDIANALGM